MLASITSKYWGFVSTGIITAVLEGRCNGYCITVNSSYQLLAGTEQLHTSTCTRSMVVVA